MQLSVPTIGLRLSDHFHPGSRVAFPKTTPPTITSSTFPLGKVRTSSAVAMFFFVNLFIDITILNPYKPVTNYDAEDAPGPPCPSTRPSSTNDLTGQSQHKLSLLFL